MQSHFPKTPFFLSVTFFILSCFIFLFFYTAIGNHEEKSQSREKEWQNEARRRDDIKALDRSVEIIAAEMAELETHFARSSDIVPFLDTIEGSASKAGAQAEITSVNVLEDHTGLVVGMKASGTFNNLYRFLTLLENSQYELEFVGMDMERGTALIVAGKNVSVPEWSMISKIKLLSFIE